MTKLERETVLLTWYHPTHVDGGMVIQATDEEFMLLRRLCEILLDLETPFVECGLSISPLTEVRTVKEAVDWLAEISGYRDDPDQWNEGGERTALDIAFQNAGYGRPSGWSPSDIQRDVENWHSQGYGVDELVERLGAQGEFSPIYMLRMHHLDAEWANLVETRLMERLASQ